MRVEYGVARGMRLNAANVVAIRPAAAMMMLAEIRGGSLLIFFFLKIYFSLDYVCT